MSKHIRNLAEKSLLWVLSMLIVVLSCISWGKIISGNTAESELAQNDLVNEKTVERLKDNVMVFSGALLVLARYLPLPNSDE